MTDPDEFRYKIDSMLQHICASWLEANKYKILKEAPMVAANCYDEQEEGQKQEDGETGVPDEAPAGPGSSYRSLLTAESKMAFMHWLRSNNVEHFKDHPSFRQASAHLAGQVATVQQKLPELFEAIALIVSANIKPEWVYEIRQRRNQNVPDVFFSGCSSSLNEVMFLRLRSRYTLQLAKMYCSETDRHALDAVTARQANLRLLEAMDALADGDVAFQWRQIGSWIAAGNQTNDQLKTFLEKLAITGYSSSSESSSDNEAAEHVPDQPDEPAGSDAIAEEAGDGAASSEQKHEPPPCRRKLAKKTAIGDHTISCLGLTSKWMSQFVPAGDPSSHGLCAQGLPRSLRGQNYVRSLCSQLESILYSKEEQSSSVRLSWPQDTSAAKSTKFQFKYTHALPEGKKIKRQKDLAEFKDAIMDLTFYFAGDVVPEDTFGGIHIGAAGNLHLSVVRSWRWLCWTWHIPSSSDVSEVSLDLKYESVDMLVSLDGVEVKQTHQIPYLVPNKVAFTKFKQNQGSFFLVRPTLPSEEKSSKGAFRKETDRVTTEVKSKEFTLRAAGFLCKAERPEEGDVEVKEKTSRNKPAAVAGRYAHMTRFMYKKWRGD